MEYKVKGKSLRRDISAFVRLKKSAFTQKTYRRQEEIQDRADDILHHYRHDELQIEPKDYPALAEYIDKFGSYHKEEMLDKLQTSVNFDVRVYLEDKSKTLWQRLFPKKATPTLKASQMTSAMKKYVLMSHKATQNLFDNPHLTVKIERLRSESESHIQAFLDGKLEILPQDLNTFEHYIKTFNPAIYEGCPAKQALAKIKELRQADSTNTVVQAEPKVATVRKPIITSLGFKRKTENMWTRLSNGLKSLWSSHKPSAAKIRSIGTTGNTVWRRMRVAAVTGLVVIAGAFGLKSGSGHQDGNTELAPNANAATLVDNAPKKVIADKTVSAAQFTKVQKEQQAKDKQAEKEALIWQNYYNSTIDIVAPTVKVDKNDLYNKIQNQIDKGILHLPDGVTKEKVALNYVLFKAYGLNSSLDKALNADAKLSALQQANFERDAGIKQADIKQIAAKKYGKLSSYSAYDHADKKLQKRHAQNLKELRQMKKQASQHI